MPTIAKPKGLLLYLIDRLEDRGARPQEEDVITLCAKIQGAGHHVYSTTNNPGDNFLRSDIGVDIDSLYGCRWLEKGKDYLSLTRQGREFLSGMVPPEGMIPTIEELLKGYRPRN